MSRVGTDFCFEEGFGLRFLMADGLSVARLVIVAFFMSYSNFFLS